MSSQHLTYEHPASQITYKCYLNIATNSFNSLFNM
jgi:hypothetical protein